MKDKIEDSIKKLKMDSLNDFFSINVINEWLDKNLNLYNESKLKWNVDSCFSELPCCHTLNNEISVFINLYEKLTKIVELNSYEEYFMNEINIYQSFKQEITQVKKWVEKNEEIVHSKFHLFFLDYLDYSNNTHHLKVHSSNFNEFEIYINRRIFENTISFLEIFNKLYWVEQILPESIERRNCENNLN